MKTVRTFLAGALAVLAVSASAEEPRAARAKSEERPQAAAYVAPMSHLDLTFMGTVEECLSRGGKVFAGTLDLLEKQPDFRFLVEYVLFLEAYRAMHPEQAAKLDEHIRAGRVELGAEWSGLYVTQEDEEDLVRNILYAKAYARDRYKLELETLQLTDIPGVVPQLPQLCAGLGIRNLVLTRSAAPDALFWYESPGGARVLTWSSKGYNQASGYGAHLDVATMRKRGLTERLADAAKSGVPPLFYYGSDQWLPPPNLAPTVRAWNAEASKQQQLAITTPTTYFRTIRAAGVADKAPVMRGELPSTWPYLEPAHAHVSRWDAVATWALDAAERLSTLAWLRAGRPYPQAELEQIWKSLLLARDHNYGGQGAGGGQARKFAERRNVQHRAQVLASQAMAALAERVEAPHESVPVVVFNTLNWDRSDVVHAHVNRYEAASGTEHDIFPRGGAMMLRGPDGQPVPFQITADRRNTLGEFDFAFVARNVPALGYASYTLEPATPAEAAIIETKWATGRPRAVQRVWFEAESPELVLENGAVRVAIERATGLTKLTSLRGKAAVAVDGLGLNGRQELPEVCRRPPLGLSVDDPAREKIEPFVPAGPEAVRLLADGPVLTSAAVRGSVLGAPAELRYTLHRDLPWVDVEVRIDWDLRKFGRIELAYQVPLKNARAAYGLPFGAGAFGAEQLMPGSGPIGGDEGSRASWERTREISRWLDVGDGTRGVAMATSHRWTRVDDGDTGAAVRCCLLRGGRMRPPDPATNGPDLRVGLVFNFRFYPHGNPWQAARVPRVGWEVTQPLLAYTVNDTWSQKSLPKRQSLATVTVASGKGDALLTCLKQAEDGKGVVARWYEPAGQPCSVRAALSPTASAVRRSDMMEKLTGGEAVDGVVATRAHEIVTVRTEK
ncbi:MAG: glycosyl hydrolase-related protein [Verrucomicrobiia bacterium]|jgi:alpha-mannosidase